MKDTLSDNKQELHVIRKDPWFGIDKVKHFLCSGFLAGISTIYARKMCNFSRRGSIRFGMGFTFSLGLAKEIKDYNSKKSFFSYKDLIADFFGLTLSALIIGWC